MRADQVLQVARMELSDTSAPNDPVLIVANGEHSELIKPFAGGGDLCAAFATIKSPDELLRFINDHGPLTTVCFPPSPPNEVAASMRRVIGGEFVAIDLENAKIFRDLLRLKAQGDTRRLASCLESDKSVSFRSIGRVELVGDSKSGVRLKLCPPDLLAALRYQLGLKLSTATLRSCRLCQSVFECGVGTGLRVDAEFCCHDHKVKYFNDERSRAFQQSRR